MKVTVIAVVIGDLCTVTKGLVNKRMSGDHPNYSIVVIGQNTESSPGNLRRLVATQSSVKDHQKNSQGVK